MPYPLVDLHVDQFLRGASDKTDLQAESHWVPPRPPQYGVAFFDSGWRGTAFDHTEPKSGNRYLVGFPILEVDKRKAYISGAIDLSNHHQAMLVPEVEPFLAIETAAGTSKGGGGVLFSASYLLLSAFCFLPFRGLLLSFLPLITED